MKPPCGFSRASKTLARDLRATIDRVADGLFSRFHTPGDDMILVKPLRLTRAAYGEGWGSYPVDANALAHSAGVEQETSRSQEAYARFTPGGPAILDVHAASARGDEQKQIP